MLELNAPIQNLRGADYNPRRIEDADLERLRASIELLGVVKPIIVRGDLIVAGHQRTKALRALGVETAPVYRLPVATTLYDEIRFNQLHNGTDLDAGDEALRVPIGLEPGYHALTPADVSGNMRASMAGVREMIARLIVNYGPWGACVATPDGEIIHAAQYALAAKLTRSPLHTFVVPAEKAEEAKSFLSATYGQFCYDALERKTYVQTYAQMHRLRPRQKGQRLAGGLKSTLYETMVIPWLRDQPGARILDFGSGQGDYFKRMKAEGYRISEVEFYRRKGGSNIIDREAVERQIDGLVSELKKRGGFDAIVCDSVVNSVDCIEAEQAVMGTLNALLRTGGTLFFSGRTHKQIEGAMRSTRRTSSKGAGARYVEFLDEHGFSALYRKGQWFFQKFHSREQVQELAKNHGFAIEAHSHGQVRNVSFQVRAKKVAEMPANHLKKQVEYEFSLPLPNGLRYARSEDVLQALRG